jgi:hypothetical protein
MILDRCPSTLAPGFETFSPAARKRLFGNQTVSHLLPYDSVYDNPEDAGKSFLAWGNRIGLPEKTVQRELDRFCASYEKMDQLVDRSFLSDELKAVYKSHYTTRRETYLKSIN